MPHPLKQKQKQTSQKVNQSKRKYLMKSFVDLNHLTLLTPTKAKLFSDCSKRWYKQAKAKNAEKLIKLVVVSGVGEVVLVVGAKGEGGGGAKGEDRN